MNFWEQNKRFVIIVGAILVVYLYLWPDLLGYWLTPWRGPVVTRLDRRQYEDAQRQMRQVEKQFQEYYHTTGQTVVPVGEAIHAAIEGNKVLLENFEAMHRWMSFVPRYPFRIPAGRTEKNKRQRYVSQAYTYARDGELLCDEFGQVSEPDSGIVFSCATRNIGLGDPYFGMRDMEFTDSISDPDLSILQVALVHEVGQLAIRCGVDEITALAPRSPYVWKLRDKEVAKAFPIDVTVKCDLPTLMKMLHALDGAHGRVAEVRQTGPPPGEEPPAPVPAAALPEGAPAAEGPPPPPPPETLERVVVRLYGEPTVFPPEAGQGASRERLTIFRPAGDESHQLVFVANAVIARTLGDGQIEAEIEPNSTLRFHEDGSHTRVSVRRGDYAASRFLLVRSMKVTAAEGRLELDKDGFPASFTPPHLVVDLSLAALQFLELKMPKIVRKRHRVKQAPIHRGW